MRVLRLGKSPSALDGVGEGIAREELAGLAYMLWGRLVALGLLALWAALTVPFERSGLYLAAIAAFALLGAPPYLLARRGIGSTPVTAAFLQAITTPVVVTLLSTSLNAAGFAPLSNSFLPLPSTIGT